jgi:hypothetical protein
MNSSSVYLNFTSSVTPLCDVMCHSFTYVYTGDFECHAIFISN